MNRGLCIAIVFLFCLAVFLFFYLECPATSVYTVQNELYLTVETDREDVRLPVRWAVPVGWVVGDVRGFRVASFVVQDGDRILDVSVSKLTSGAYSLLPNVNRWRGQLGLSVVTINDLDNLVNSYLIGKNEWVFVERMAGGSEGMVVALMERSNEVWFFKMMGDVGLLDDQIGVFREFLGSVVFDD